MPPKLHESEFKGFSIQVALDLAEEMGAIHGEALAQLRELVERESRARLFLSEWDQNPPGGNQVITIFDRYRILERYPHAEKAMRAWILDGRPKLLRILLKVRNDAHGYRPMIRLTLSHSIEGKREIEEHLLISQEFLSNESYCSRSLLSELDAMQEEIIGSMKKAGIPTFPREGRIVSGEAFTASIWTFIANIK